MFCIGILFITLQNRVLEFNQYTLVYLQIHCTEHLTDIIHRANLADDKLSLSKHNYKVEMELQLKEKKLLETKNNTDGNKRKSLKRKIQTQETV